MSLEIDINSIIREYDNKYKGNKPLLEETVKTLVKAVDENIGGYDDENNDQDDEISIKKTIRTVHKLRSKELHNYFDSSPAITLPSRKTTSFKLNNDRLPLDFLRIDIKDAKFFGGYSTYNLLPSYTNDKLIEYFKNPDLIIQFANEIANDNNPVIFTDFYNEYLNLLNTVLVNIREERNNNNSSFNLNLLQKSLTIQKYGFKEKYSHNQLLFINLFEKSNLDTLRSKFVAHFRITMKKYYNDVIMNRNVAIDEYNRMRDEKSEDDDDNNQEDFIAQQMTDDTILEFFSFCGISLVGESDLTNTFYLMLESLFYLVFTSETDFFEKSETQLQYLKKYEQLIIEMSQLISSDHQLKTVFAISTENDINITRDLLLKLNKSMEKINDNSSLFYNTKIPINVPTWTNIVLKIMKMFFKYDMRIDRYDVPKYQTESLKDTFPNMVLPPSELYQGPKKYVYSDQMIFKHKSEQITKGRIGYCVGLYGPIGGSNNKLVPPDNPYIIPNHSNVIFFEPTTLLEVQSSITINYDFTNLIQNGNDRESELNKLLHDFGIVYKIIQELKTSKFMNWELLTRNHQVNKLLDYNSYMTGVGIHEQKYIFPKLWKEAIPLRLITVQPSKVFNRYVLLKLCKKVDNLYEKAEDTYRDFMGELERSQNFTYRSLHAKIRKISNNIINWDVNRELEVFVRDLAEELMTQEELDEGIINNFLNRSIEYLTSINLKFDFMLKMARDTYINLRMLKKKGMKLRSIYSKVKKRSAFLECEDDLDANIDKAKQHMAIVLRMLLVRTYRNLPGSFKNVERTITKFYNSLMAGEIVIRNEIEEQFNTCEELLKNVTTPSSNNVGMTIDEEEEIVDNNSSNSSNKKRKLRQKIKQKLL